MDRDGDFSCLNCATPRGHKPLMRSPANRHYYRPEERRRALSIASRVGFAEAARELGIVTSTLYAFRKRGKA